MKHYGSISMDSQALPRHNMPKQTFDRNVQDASRY
jgi:hypothetical protein